MKIYLPLRLRAALVRAIVTLPCLTSLLAPSLWAGEGRIWTLDKFPSSENSKDYFKGGIKDKTFEDIDYETDTNHWTYEYASSFGGAAIALSYLRQDTLFSFYYEGFENVNFYNNTYTAKALLEDDMASMDNAAGGAVLIADCTVGAPDLPDKVGIVPSGVNWGINDCHFQSNTITTDEEIDLAGGGLALYSSGKNADTSTLTEGLISYLYALSDNTFELNTVSTSANGRGGAFAIYDYNLNSGAVATMGARGTLGRFVGGISGNNFRYNVVKHTGDGSIVIAEPEDSSAYAGYYGFKFVNSNVVMGGGIYTNSGLFNSDANYFYQNQVTSNSTAAAFGGAIAMEGKVVYFLGIGNAENIDEAGNKNLFEENLAFSAYNKAAGGAVADLGANWVTENEFTLSDLGASYYSKVVANFNKNYAIGGLETAGGALYMFNNNYGKIEGHFSGNSAISHTRAEGGAIALEHDFYYAAFTKELIESEDTPDPFGVAYIGGTFSHNSISYRGEILDKTINLGSLAEGYGGAIALVHNFTVNTLSAEMSQNSVSADLAYGGALHLRDSRINYIHLNQDINVYADYKNLIWDYDHEAVGNMTSEKDQLRYTELHTEIFALAGVEYQKGMELNSQQQGQMILTIHASLYDETADPGFYYNSVIAQNNAYGGAISLERSDIYAIAVKFSNNSVQSLNAEAYGGALYVVGGLDDYSHFIYGEDNKTSTIDYISGLMSGNSSNGVTGAYGGAVALFNKTHIYDIHADFEKNRATVSNSGSGSGLAAGGAIALWDNTSIDNVIGDFTANYVRSTDSAMGGAIALQNARITSISGTFSENEVRDSATDARGGAIALKSSRLSSIEGNLYDNKIVNATGYAQGGALSLESSTLNSIDAHISGNGIEAGATEARGGALALYTSTISSMTGKVEDNYISGNDAKGGAIALFNGSSIESFSATLSGNYISTTLDKNSSSAVGAAIYNEDSSFTFNATSTSTIRDNKIIYSDLSEEYQFLYNTVTSADKTATVNFNTSLQTTAITIAIHDAISGAEDFVDSQFIYINPNGAKGRVILTNSISNQTVIVENGTLDISADGIYADEQGSFINSHLIINSLGSYASGARLTIEDDRFDSKSRITNNKGILDIYSSELNLASIVNNNFVRQNADLVLNSSLSSSAKDLESSGIWFITSTAILGSSDVLQGYRLSLSRDDLISQDDVGNSVYGKQQFIMENDYSADYDDISQLTFDSIETFEELLLNEAISIELDLQLFSNIDTDNVKWTFVGWENGGALSEAALLRLNELFSYTLSNSSLPSEEMYLHHSYNGITLSFKETLTAPIDAKYQLNSPDPDILEQQGFALDVHRYEGATASLSALEKRVVFEGMLGDDSNLSSPDAERITFTWVKDVNGLLTLKELGSGDLYLQRFTAYSLGEAVAVGTAQVYHKSYIAVERAEGEHVFFNSSNDITLMDADFVGNSSTIGILRNENSTISKMNADFVGNTYNVSADAASTGHAGAISNASVITSFKGDFIANSVVSRLDSAEKNVYAGAVSNTGTLVELNGDFVSNYAYTQKAAAYGGALANLAGEASIGTLNSKFYSNFVQGYVAQGGAIYELNSKGIAAVNGLFDGNYAMAQIDSDSENSTLNAAGGAIYRQGVSDESQYKADFIANFAKASVADSPYGDNWDVPLHVGGGALYNKDSSGAITSIEGSFYGNHAEIYSPETYSRLDAGQSLTISAVGGAIANVGSSIGNISADFLGNYVQVDVGGIGGFGTQIMPYRVEGGAIYNEAGSLGLLALDKSMTFEGNRTIVRYAVGDIEIEEISFNALHNAGNSTIRLNAYGTNNIIFNDGISGESASVATQLLEINRGYDGQNNAIHANGAGYSIVEFNNSVSYQTINVHAGTLRFGDYTGRTFSMADGSSFETADSSGKLTYSQLNLLKGARVEASMTNLGYGNTIAIHQGAVLAASGGYLQTDIQLQGGVIELSGVVGTQITQEGDAPIISLTKGSGHSVIKGVSSQRSAESDTLRYATIVMEELTSLTLSHVSIVGLSLDASNADAVLMDNVSLDISSMSTSLTMGGKLLQFKDSMLTGLSVSDKDLIDKPTGGYFTQSMAVYSLTNLNVFSDLDVEGRLTLDLDDLLTFDVNEFTAFRLVGISELNMWHGNIYVRINGQDYQIMGATNNGMAGMSDIYLFIPEPSTATLSLLALAGLLARRRRKAA